MATGTPAGGLELFGGCGRDDHHRTEIDVGGGFGIWAEQIGPADAVPVRLGAGAWVRSASKGGSGRSRGLLQPVTGCPYDKLALVGPKITDRSNLAVRRLGRWDASGGPAGFDVASAQSDRIVGRRRESRCSHAASGMGPVAHAHRLNPGCADVRPSQLVRQVCGCGPRRQDRRREGFEYMVRETLKGDGRRVRLRAAARLGGMVVARGWRDAVPLVLPAKARRQDGREMEYPGVYNGADAGQCTATGRSRSLTRDHGRRLAAAIPFAITSTARGKVPREQAQILPDFAAPPCHPGQRRRRETVFNGIRDRQTATLRSNPHRQAFRVESFSSSRLRLWQEMDVYTAFHVDLGSTERAPCCWGARTGWSAGRVQLGKMR